jgi:N-methylhydantoinase B
MARRSPRRSSRAPAACSVAEARTTVDPVTAEVVRSMLETICFEMATFVSRTATTPILNQSNERNATILDGQGRLAALSVGIPQFMLSSTLPVRFALDFLAGELYPGDVLVANDPYHGGGHLPDFNVFAPVFAGDDLVLVASIQCHHGDTGGALAGGYNVFAKDIWSEGTRYPLLKIIEAGRERRDVVLTMRANNRLAGFVGDLRAQVGAAQLGARRLGEVIATYGADTVHAAVDWTIDDAHRRFAAEIERWPDGRYEADVFVDADPAGNKDIHVHVAVTVDGDRLVVDFDGSDRRPEIQAWSTFGNTRGYTIAQLASLVDPSIPKNEGFFDCVELRVPEGTCVNPTEGKPVSSGTHHPGVEVGDAVALAMAQILPDRCAPQTYKYGSPRQMWGDLDPRTGQPFFDHGGEVNAGWVNAVRDVDGWGALVASNGNLIKASAEINEALFPHLLRGRNYLTDSGGAGQWRGGCGSEFVKEVRTPTSVNQYVVNQRHTHPGIAGGRNGSPDSCVISAGTPREVTVAPSVAGVEMATGDALVYRFGGGGGWGDPLARDPAAVLDDVWDEYVSVDAAHEEYGVVVTGSLEDMTLAVDEAATRELRARRRGRAEPRG